MDPKVNLLADAGAERAGGETRGPHMTPEERAERDAWLALFAALGNNINAMDPNDPIHRKRRPEESDDDYRTEHGRYTV